MNSICCALSILALLTVSISALQCREYVSGTILDANLHHDDGVVNCDPTVQLCFRLMGEGVDERGKAGNFDAGGCDIDGECVYEKLKDGDCKNYNGTVQSNIQVKMGKACCSSDHTALAKITL